MQVSVEKLNNVERRLTIVVPADEVEEAYSQQINKFAKNSNLKGFRKGKAPVSYIQQRYGSEARQEAVSQVIQNTLYKALAENKLIPITTPRIEPKVITANQPLEYDVFIEVMPEITSIEFAATEIEKLIVDVTDADVSYVIDQLMKQHTEWQVVEEAAKEHHRVLIDYHSIFEGKTDMENKVQDFPLELGSKIMLPGFEDGLLDAKAGDEKTLNLHYPADFANAEKAGKPIEFVVTIKKVYQALKPELDEDFIKRLGVISGQRGDLDQQIKKSLIQERDRLVKEKLKEQVFRDVLEQNKIEIPNSMVQREAKHIHDEIHPQHHNHHDHSEAEMKSFEDMARKRVTLGLLVAEYAKQQNLKPDQTLVEERIREISEVYESPKEVADWLSSKEQRRNIEAQVLEDQVIAKLTEGVPVKERMMSYSELKGIRI
jgi:trigger factor